MKKLTLLFFLFASFTSFGQETRIIANNYTSFQLQHKKDTIDFVVADTSLNSIKPVLLFCQGSQPVPLFIDFGERGTVPVTLNNFDINRMKEQYHVVVISMPKTPLSVSPRQLNRSYCYVQDTSYQYSYHPEYLESDYLENYVGRANRVLKFLFKQKWVDKEKTVIAGHSQGARVAVAIAASNKRIRKLGLFGFNPLGRVHQLVWTHRKHATLKNISWDKADSLQQEEYLFYKDICNEDSIAENPVLRNWYSFSHGSLSELSKLKIPVYIAFGSEDVTAEYCDLLPLHFIEHKKTNYVVKRYPHLEHNFFPKLADGKIDYANGQWTTVMNSFLEWSEQDP